MPTTFDTPFGELTTQWVEASTRALAASAELYTHALRFQVDATRDLVETYAGLGSQTTDRTAEATTEVARKTGRAAQRATRRTATATRRATKRAKPVAKAITKAATAEPPIAGYDELNADEAQKLVTSGDAALAAAVRDYERRHKSRSRVLEAAAPNADES